MDLGILILIGIVIVPIAVMVLFDPLDKDKRYDDHEFCREVNEHCGQIGCTGGIGSHGI